MTFAVVRSSKQDLKKSDLIKPLSKYTVISSCEDIQVLGPWEFNELDEVKETE